jgi:CheY-specific phosphatase CheX
MNVKFLNPFVDAAYEILQIETGIVMERGQLGLEKNAYVTDQSRRRGRGERSVQYV